MKRTFILAGVTATAIFGFTSAANAYDNCRTYKQTRSINGFYETGYATACYSGRGEWLVTEMRGPIELRSPLIETVKRDVFRIGGAKVTLTSTSYHQPAYVYQPRRGGFVTPQRYTYTYTDWRDTDRKHKKYDKHDRHHDHRSDWDRDDDHDHDHDHDRNRDNRHRH